MRTIVSNSGLAASLFASITLVACAGDGSAPTAPRSATRAVSLSFTTMVVGGAAGQTNAATASLVKGDLLSRQGVRPSASVFAVSGTDTLVITKAQVVLARLELANSTVATCDDDSSAPGCEEVERSLVLVDLPTDTSVRTVVNATIPPGTYSSLEAKLRAAHKSDDADASQFLATHPEFQGANVRVEGTFRGKPFVYTGTAEGRLELTFAPPLVVDSSGLNITINVSLANWFRASDGSLIDPATANAGGVNASVVANNVRRSFHAFRDDKHEGHDHGGGQGNGNGGSDDNGRDGHN